MNLIIVESPAKCLKIKHFLESSFPNKKFNVISTGGHIEEIKTPGLNIDFENNFEAKYVFKNNKFVKSLLLNSKKAENIYIATDLDYSGSFIGYSVCKLLNIDIDKTKRLIFNSITKSAIVNAFNNPVKLDINHVNYEKSRQIIDRIIGFKLSPLAYQYLKSQHNSVGRCQTVALRLIVEKEKEITEKLNNNTSSFYKIKVNLNLLNDTIIATNNINESVIKSFNNKSLTFSIKDITIKKTITKPDKPFITSTLQCVASSKFGYSVSFIMKILQKLYEKGLITYIRTDCHNISSEFKKKIQDYIKLTFSNDYVNYSIKDSFQEHSQNGHEAIRITDLDLDIDIVDLTTQEKNIYKLIRLNTIQSQMKDNIVNNVKIVFVNNLNDIEVSSNIQTLIFDGFKILSNNDKYYNLDEINKLYKNQKVNYYSIYFEYCLDSVPLHYNEHKLIKKLEQLGIGRPSTFSYIVNVIQEREYVIKTDIKGINKSVLEYEIKNKEQFTFNTIENNKTFYNENNKLIPTEKGIRLIDFMTEYFNYIIDYNYTSDIELELDKIVNNEVDYLSVLKEFWMKLNNHLKDYKIVIKTKSTKNERYIGVFNNQKIILKNGLYGYYTKINNKNKSIKINKEFNDITIEDVIEYLKEEKDNIIGNYENQEIKLFNGPFGYYFTYNNKNYNLKNIDIKDSNLLNHCIEIIQQNIKTIKTDKKEYVILRSINNRDKYYINVYTINKTKNKYVKTIFINNKDIEELLNNNIYNITYDFIEKIENKQTFRRKKK